MLPKQPQSITQLFFNSLKAYKKIFISLLPIIIMQCAILALTSVYKIDFHTGIQSMRQPEMGWPFFILFFIFLVLVLMFGIIFYCWEINFIREVLVKRKINYKSTLVTVFEKFLSILGLLLINLMIGILISAIVVLFYLLGNKIVMGLVFIVLIPICVLYFYVFFFSFLELINGSKVLCAIEKALTIIFKIESIWRILVTQLIMALMILLVIGGMFLILLLPYKWIDPIVAILSMLIPVVLTYPLIITNGVYLYNDLVLRGERPHK